MVKGVPLASVGRGRLRRRGDGASGWTGLSTNAVHERWALSERKGSETSLAGARTEAGIVVLAAVHDCRPTPALAGTNGLPRLAFGLGISYRSSGKTSVNNSAPRTIRARARSIPSG